MWKRSGCAARTVAGAVACAAALAFAPAAAIAKPAAGHTAAHLKGRKSAQSIGAPNNGRLVGAARLRGSKTLRQREGTHSWGLPQLVHLIQHTAAAVARKHHGSQMLVGDLSGRTGGHLDRHGSHQTGRDADVGFYVTNSKGKPMAVKRFIPFDDAGNARDVQGVRFDEARNWTMIESMLKSETASVRYLFITNGLRAKLLAYAAKKHVSKELLEKAASTMMSPQDAELHDDHVHVRISCPESMRDVCVEEAVAHEAREPAAPASATPAADENAGATPADAPANVGPGPNPEGALAAQPGVAGGKAKGPGVGGAE